MNRSGLFFGLFVLTLCQSSVAQTPPPPPIQVPSTQQLNDSLRLGQDLQRLNEQVRLGEDIHQANDRVLNELRILDARTATRAAVQQPLPLVPAAIELRHALAAAPSDQERLRDLRHTARQQLQEIQNYGWQLSFVGLTTILSISPDRSGDSDDPERMLAEVRRLVGEYLATQAEIESITHDSAKAEERRQRYAENLTILTKATTLLTLATVRQRQLRISFVKARILSLQARSATSKPELLIERSE